MKNHELIREEMETHMMTDPNNPFKLPEWGDPYEVPYEGAQIVGVHTIKRYKPGTRQLKTYQVPYFTPFNPRMSVECIKALDLKTNYFGQSEYLSLRERAERLLGDGAFVAELQKRIDAYPPYKDLPKFSGEVRREALFRE